MHDFGRLGPDRDVTHLFSVRNGSPRDWKLRKIVQSCTCSVAKASSETIKAGGSETFEFKYHAPGKAADERRWVTLVFDGPEEHVVRLVITAQVRPEMTAKVDALNLGNVRAGAKASQAFEVGNFGDADWTTIEAVDAPAWLRVDRPTQITGTWTGAAPRQTWMVDARVNTDSLIPGSYRAMVTFRADAGGATASLPVAFQVGTPVTSSPSLLMFGAIDATKTAEATAILTFFDGPPSFRPEDVAAKLASAPDSRVTWKVAANDRWALTLALNPGAVAGPYFSDDLVLTFPGGSLPDVKIPVRGRIVSGL